MPSHMCCIQLSVVQTHSVKYVNITASLVSHNTRAAPAVAGPVSGGSGAALRAAWNQPCRAARIGW
ncbi:hypothetical protein FMUBM48_50110 [Nocardia cyriacigeorgica]|nr:hypothetical protein FMUBM48_50110 [Nocardia cyriacigeorgica]